MKSVKCQLCLLLIDTRTITFSNNMDVHYFNIKYLPKFYVWLFLGCITYNIFTKKSHIPLWLYKTKNTSFHSYFTCLWLVKIQLHYSFHILLWFCNKKYIPFSGPQMNLWEWLRTITTWSKSVNILCTKTFTRYTYTTLNIDPLKQLKKKLTQICPITVCISRLCWVLTLPSCDVQFQLVSQLILSIWLNHRGCT